MKTAVMIDGFRGAGFTVEGDDKGFLITPESAWRTTLINPMALLEGGTIGDANRKALHDYLDEWIDEMLGKGEQ